MDLLTPSFGLIIWTLLAFLIVFFILNKYAWPAITKGLKDRETTIADSLSTAERIKAEMACTKIPGRWCERKNGSTFPFKELSSQTIKILIK